MPEGPRTAPRWVLLCGRGGGQTDALRQYSEALAEALSDAGCRARVEAVPAPRARTSGDPRVTDVVGRQDRVLVLQYNPFSFGHLGLAPGLVRDLVRLRRSRPGLRIVMMCHETIALTPGPGWWGVRQLHRLQLAAVVRLADQVVVSTGQWIPTLRRLGARQVERLPVGSNLPDRRADREEVRRRLGLDGRLVVASFSTGHPSHRDDYLAAALAAVLERRPDAAVLTLGAGRQPVLPLGGSHLELAPGMLPAGRLAALLGAADLFVSPYVDGVSTRRGTMMTALQHAVPVVATTGESTDDDLRRLLGRWGVPACDGAAAFADAVDALAEDDGARALHGPAGRARYVEAYDWPVIAARLAALVGDVAEVGRRGLWRRRRGGRRSRPGRTA